MKQFSRLILIGIALSFLAAPASAKKQKHKEEKPAAVAQPAPPVSPLPPPNDTALLLAGMPVPNNSPLAGLMNDPAWLEHSAFFEKAFAKLNTKQLYKLHTWQETYLPESLEPLPVAYYMFSGPDFLYVDQFFPKASVYILCGQESMGPPPDPLRLKNLGAAFQNLETAMNSSLRYSFVITKDMKIDLQQQQLNGTVPILYVYLARAGKMIREVTYGSLDSGGTFHQNAPGRGETPGLRINFTDKRSGQNQTLFYFTTDLSDGGVSSKPGFLKFCGTHGVGASLLKSSSYLMFEGNFTRVRNFVLDHSKMIVQDDAGVPIADFNRNKWNLRLFGKYLGPIAIFRQHYQQKLKTLFEESNPPPVSFNYGYRWNWKESHVIVATRN